MSEANPSIPSFLADVGNVSAIGSTVHVVLGTTTPMGDAVHRAHVAVSREFAYELALTLLRAVRGADSDAEDAAESATAAAG